jgi:hypothetical protein
MFSSFSWSSLSLHFWSPVPYSSFQWTCFVSRFHAIHIADSAKAEMLFIDFLALFWLN